MPRAGAALIAAGWLAVAGAAAAARPADSPPAPETGGWLERLQRRLDGIQSFQARFIQEYEPRAFARRQREGGTVLFRRPGRMRWEYEWPERKLAVSDGRNAWIYYPDEKRVEVESLAALGDDAPALQLLLGRWRLAERFGLEGISRSGDEVTLHLTPRPALEMLRALRVSVREADLALSGIEGEEPGGNLLRYRFEEWSEGGEWGEELFRFEPPEGVKVVGDPAPPGIARP